LEKSKSTAMETKKVITGAEDARQTQGSALELSVYPLLCECVWGKSHGIAVVRSKVEIQVVLQL